MGIVVVGGGAIGSLIAGRLAQAGHQTALLGRAAAMAALRQSGLTITQDGVTDAVQGLYAAASVDELPSALHRPDLAVLAVKSYDTAGALPRLRELDPALVLTVQNGIGNEEELAADLGNQHVLSGVVTSSVELPEPGQVVVTKTGGLGLARVSPSQDIHTWAGLLREAGFTVHAYGDYRAMKWSKALLNMIGNATAAILDMPVDAIYADAALAGLERRALLEALAVMGRLHVRPVNLPRYPAAVLATALRTLPPGVLRPVLRRMVAGGRGGKMPSLHIDLARGRVQSEGQYLYGAVAAHAARLHLPAPVNGTLWAVLHAIASGTRPWDEFRQRPEALLAEVEAAVAAEMPTMR